MAHSFILTGGGTAGHVFPTLAVAQVLRDRGHKLLYVGTRDGMEARLVPDAGYEIEFVKVGGLNRVGLRKQIQTMAQIPASICSAWALLRRFRPHAIFSMGGYVAGPVMMAAVLARVPLVVMEPNAIPGLAIRRVARHVYRALLAFESARRWFPPSKSEITGAPVRSAFFDVSAKQQEGKFSVLITGGSRGARNLNRAVRESWPFFLKAASPVRILHQTGIAEYEALSSAFVQTGLDGEIVPFIKNMPEAFAATDLVIARSGGTINEIAAASMPSILVPFPFAADNHQERNAEMFVRAGAAEMILDRNLSGETLFHTVEELRASPSSLERMRANVRKFARPGAAERAAEVLEEAATQKKVRPE